MKLKAWVFRHNYKMIGNSDVRTQTRKSIHKLLTSTLDECDIDELDGACWSRAVTLAFSSSDIDRIYVQSCRDAVANLCLSELNNGNTRLAGAITSQGIFVDQIPNMTASELRPGVHRPTPSRCCDDGTNTARATNLFECPRCSERKCTHYELQTRSADEATTVFVACVACGHKWTE